MRSANDTLSAVRTAKTPDFFVVKHYETHARNALKTATLLTDNFIRKKAASKMEITFLLRIR